MSYFQDLCVKRKALECEAFDRSAYFASNQSVWTYKEYDLSFPSWEQLERLTNLTCP